MESVLTWVNSGLAIFVVIGLCLFFHETGHFLAAKACRMGVHEFAMGFGPVIWRRTRGGTDYSVRAIPFGGFVRIAGMEPGDTTSVPNGFHTRPRWQGLIVVSAGAFMNIVLAVLLYWGISVFSGVPIEGNQDIIVRDVFADTPAERAGAQPDDRIVGIGGSIRSTDVQQVVKGSLGDKMGLRAGIRVFQIGDTPVATPADVLRLLRAGVKKGAKVWVLDPTAAGLENRVVPLEPPAPSALTAVPEPLDHETGDRLARSTLGVTFGAVDQFAVHRFISQSPGETIALTVLRGDEKVRLRVTPEPDTDRVEMVDETGKFIAPHRTVGRMGIVLGPALRRAGVIEGLRLGVQDAYLSVASVILGIKAMLLKQIAATPAGPIGIMAMTAETAKLGWAPVLALCGLISANLAVINMLPIPPFDGFSVVLLGIEGLIRRRINQRLEVFVRVGGIVLVLNLFIFLFYNDVMNLIVHGTY